MASEPGSSATLHKNRALYDHPSSLVKIGALLSLLPEGARRILDAGSGDGRLAAELGERGYAVSGLDANAAAVSSARARGIEATVADLEQPWPVSDASADLVLFLDVLEHLVRPDAALREAARALVPGGHLVIAFPNHFDLRQRMEMLLGRGIVHWSHRRYEHHEAADYGHVRFLRHEELDRMLEDAGFRIRAWQWNFMGGGLLPRRALPRFFRTFLARRFPNLFSGKFVALAEKTRSEREAPKIIVLPETPAGL